MTNLFGDPRRTLPESRDVHAQARAWLIELDDEPVAARKVAELREWLARSPLHRRAFEQAAAAWHDMDCLRSVLDGKQVAGAGVRGAAPLHSSEPARRFGGSWVRFPALLAAAAVVLMVTFGLVEYLRRPAGGQAVASTFTTATGEVKALTLSDGSTVHLNTDSRVRVAYGNNARIVQLLSGEAYFTVAADPRRPFVVYAGRYAVRALGTAFAVHMVDSGVDLTVTNGRVEFASLKKAPADITGAGAAGAGLGRGDGAETRVPLSSGQHATVAHNLKLVEQIDAKGIEKRLSWRDGMLVFDDDPLTDVVAEISRYTATRIVISDPSIRGLKVGGYFKIQDIGLILDTLQDGFGIDVKRDSDKVVYLSRGRGAH